MPLFKQFTALFSRPRRAHFARPEGGSSETDPLSPPVVTSTGTVTGNSYTTYDSQVKALYLAYNHRAEFGSGLARSVIDWRATQIAGNGFAFDSDDKRTNEWLQKWATDNQLTGRRGWALVRDSELEGKALLQNTVAKGPDGESIVRTRGLPWYRWRYQVKTDPADPETAIGATYTDAAGKEISLSGDNLAFARLSGTTANDTTYLDSDAPPRAGAVLWHLEAIDRALQDLRRSNRLFGAPIRHMEAPDTATQNQLREDYFSRTSRGQTESRINTSVGEFYVAAGKLYYAEPSGAAQESVLAEITMRAQLVSGMVGIPVQYMGFPNLMSNRSTAEDMHELVNATTASEREAWKGLALEAAQKAARLAMAADETLRLKPETIGVSLPVVMLSQLKTIADVWLPLYEKGLVCAETVREHIPGIDPEREREADERSKANDRADSQAVVDDLLTRVRNGQTAPVPANTPMPVIREVPNE